MLILNEQTVTIHDSVSGAHHCEISATTTRRILRSAASVRWSKWTRVAWCRTSCFSVTPSPPGRIPRTTSRRCSQRSCTASRTRSATRTGATSPTSSPCNLACASRPCAGYRRDYCVMVRAAFLHIDIQCSIFKCNPLIRTVRLCPQGNQCQHGSGRHWGWRQPLTRVPRDTSRRAAPAAASAAALCANTLTSLH